MTPDRLVEFIPSTLAVLHPHKMPSSAGDAIAMCQWFESCAREHDKLSFTLPSGPGDNRFPETFWPAPPSVPATRYALASATRVAQLILSPSAPVQFCNYPGYNPAGDLLPALAHSLRVADHVIASNGELAFSRTDFELPGPFTFQWQRFYRQSLIDGSEAGGDSDNRSLDTSGLGPGWRHSLNESLQLPDPQGGTDKKVLLHSAEGRVIAFDLPAIGHGCFNRCERLYLLRQSLHSFRLSSFDQPDKIFRADGTGIQVPLSEVRDASGNTLSVDYRNGKPVKIVTSWGRTLEFVYQGGQLVRIANGQDTEPSLCEYTFDEAGHLRDCRTPRGQENYAVHHGVMISLTSLTLGHLVLAYDRLQRVHQIQIFEDPAPASRYTQGQSSEQDSNPESRSEIAEGCEPPAPMHYRLRWRAGKHNGKLNCILSTPDQLDIHWQFDARGDLIETRQGSRISTRLYDHYRNLCRSVDPRGVDTLFRHDKFGRLLRSTCQQLNHRYVYDDSGRLIAAGAIKDSDQVHSWRYHYQESSAHPSAMVDPVGNRWQCEHDERGQLRRLIDPEGGGLVLDWDAHCQLARLSHGDQLYTWEYDAQGRITAKYSSEAPSRHWQYQADGTLNQVAIGDRTFALSSDEYGRLCAVHADGEPLLQWQYDGYSMVRSIQDSSGQRRNLRYTPRGQLSALQSGDTPSSSDTCHWYYNEYGQLARAGDGKGFQREWQYDHCGRLAEFHDSDSHWYLHYNSQGELAQIRNNSGQLCSFHFDVFGRLVQAANEHCSLRYRYDKRNRLVAEHQDLNSDAGDDGTKDSLSINHSYDKRGWLKRSASAQLNIAYTFSAAGALYGIDANGNMAVRIESQRKDHALTGKQISLGNHQLRHEYREGVLVSIHKGDRLLWKNREAGPPSPDTLATNSLTVDGRWDARGNLVSERRPADTGLARYQYQYDGWGLLYCVECGDFKTWLRYDPFGRRLSKSSTHRRSRRQRRIASHWCGTGLWNESHQLDGNLLATHFLQHPASGIPLARLSLDPEPTQQPRGSNSPFPGQREFFVADDSGRIVALLGDGTFDSHSDSSSDRPSDGTANDTGAAPRWQFDGSSPSLCPGSYQGILGIFDVETRLLYHKGHYVLATACSQHDVTAAATLDVGLQSFPRVGTHTALPANPSAVEKATALGDTSAIDSAPAD